MPRKKPKTDGEDRSTDTGAPAGTGLTKEQLERSRKGQKPLSWKTRIQKLERIRDGALTWMEQCLVSGNTRGAGTAEMLYRTSALEVERLQKIHGEAEGVKLQTHYSQLTDEMARRAAKLYPEMFDADG